VVGALLYAGSRIHWQNQEIDSLRQQAGEAADGKRKGEQLEDRLRDEQSRREKLESTLETLRQEVANTRDNAQGREAELRKALGFLREELKAAEAVIERLKAESAAKGNPSANTGSASPSTSPR
jgi:predicted  nucleic acid-binding Zn-ribbon protein